MRIRITNYCPPLTTHLLQNPSLPRYLPQPRYYINAISCFSITNTALPQVRLTCPEFIPFFSIKCRTCSLFPTASAQLQAGQPDYYLANLGLNTDASTCDNLTSFLLAPSSPPPTPSWCSTDLCPEAALPSPMALQYKTH